MRVVFTFLVVFLGFQSFSYNQTFWHTPVPDEFQDKVITIVAEKSDIYLFQDDILVERILKGSSKKVLVGTNNPMLYASKDFNLENVLFLSNENLVLKFEPRNMPLSKKNSYSGQVSVWILSLFAFIVFLKIANIDLFYGFLMPWMAYSNTEELVGKMNSRKIILPFFLLLLSVFGNIWILSIRAPIQIIMYNSMLVFMILLFKLFILSILEFLLESNGFAKKYFIQFLKISIGFSMLMFFILMLDMLNPMDFYYSYKILLILYFITWFLRMLIIFYKDRHQKFMHFFSYLCVSEAIPILILVAFWKR